MQGSIRIVRSRRPSAIALFVGGAAVLCLIGRSHESVAQTLSDPPASPTAAASRDQLAHAYDESIPDSVKFDKKALTVLDDETGKPLAGASVIVLNYVDLHNHTLETGVDGKLRFDYPYVGRVPTVFVEVRKAGYVPLRRSWGFDNDPSPPAEAAVMRLRRGETMGGIVVYARDQPVEGVTVVMTVETYGPGKRPENPTGHEVYFEVEVPTKTGPDGRWRTDSVPPGATEVHLQLIHPDFVSGGPRTIVPTGRRPTIERLRAQTDRQVLMKGAMVRGRVVDDNGAPIAGIKVVDSSHGSTFLDNTRTALTDKLGDFHMHFGRGERVKLTVQVKGFEPMTNETVVEPDSSPLEFRLKRAKVLKGRVVDPDGKPVGGAFLMTRSSERTAHGALSLRLWTDSNGRFVWDSALDEDVRFSISADGFLPYEDAVLRPRAEEIAVRLTRALDVSFRVVDADSGKPMEFNVALESLSKKKRSDSLPPIADSGYAGGYRALLEPDKGPYQFEVRSAGYGPARTRVFRGDEKLAQDVVRLRKVAAGK